MKIIGLVIMTLGLAFTVFTSISFFTSNEIIKVGAVELTRTQPEYFSWSPFVGIAAMVFGVFLILQARKRE